MPSQPFLCLVADSRNQAQLAIRWKTVSALQVYPTGIYTAKAAPGTVMEKEIRIRSNTGSNFKLENVRAYLDQSPYSILHDMTHPAADLQEHVVKISLNTPPNQGYHRVTLEFTTNLPKAKTVLVPWAIFVR